MSTKDAWTHQLVEPITLPDHVLTELNFPRMKGKYMRKFQMRVEQDQIQAAKRGEEVSASMSFSYDQYMVIGEAMLADTHGPVSAKLIFEEMSPEDVHAVVSVLGERFGGGQKTGKKR